MHALPFVMPQPSSPGEKRVREKVQFRKTKRYGSVLPSARMKMSGRAAEVGLGWCSVPGNEADRGASRKRRVLPPRERRARGGML